LQEPWSRNEWRSDIRTLIFPIARTTSRKLAASEMSNVNVGITIMGNEARSSSWAMKRAG